MATKDASLTLRVQCPKGRFIVKELTLTSTLSNLQQCIADLTNIPPLHQKILHGYPPVEISSYQTNGYLKDLKIRSGDTITVVELSEPHASLDQADSQGESPSELHNDDVIFISEERPTVKQHIDGQLARKVVPADNSCLFRSISIIVGSEAGSPGDLRDLVAGIVLSHPVHYSAVLLGRPNTEYADWVTREESWGGAIELMIFSEHFSTELDVVDIQTQRIDRFGEGRYYSQRGFLLYDGIHYDPLVLASPTGAVLQTLFPISQEGVVFEALEIAREAHQARQFTDVSNFTLRCLVCGTPLKGQNEAQDHASSTGHINFGEV